MKGFSVAGGWARRIGLEGDGVLGLRMKGGKQKQERFVRRKVGPAGAMEGRDEPVVLLWLPFVYLNFIWMFLLTLFGGWCACAPCAAELRK